MTAPEIRWRWKPTAAHPHRMMGSTEFAHAVIEDCDHARQMMNLPGHIGPIARAYLRAHDIDQDALWETYPSPALAYAEAKAAVAEALQRAQDLEAML